MRLPESIQLLSQSHPVLARARVKVEGAWLPDQPPPTVLMSALAKAIVGAANELPESDALAVLRNVERVLDEGDESSKDAVASGFLEALVAAADGGDVAVGRLMGLLGPLSIEYCDAWRSFTEGR